ncbi:Hypothetical protein R9X50_00665100 [Acrodontium crateriforme]|uniref:Uncharacterized protein n=1 Tax=Acrodontium crateriforme TaxID=150365 RepID=A0AAQ3MAG4_9PEZI|nr:Hypothetical protein R9X50_00665100 [Acrodontium crateriforme]
MPATSDELRHVACRRDLENLEAQLLDLATVHLDHSSFYVLTNASLDNIGRYWVGLMDAEEPNTFILDLIEAVMAVKAIAARAQDLESRMRAHSATKQLNWSFSPIDHQNSEPWQADDSGHVQPAFCSFHDRSDESQIDGSLITGDNDDVADNASISSDGLIVNGCALEDVFYDNRYEGVNGSGSEDPNYENAEVNEVYARE